MGYKYNDIKEVTDFVYRESVPKKPEPGTFYWVEDKNGIALYFSNTKGELLRLDNTDSNRNENITVDELNNLMKFDIDGKSYYVDMFTGIVKPTLQEQTSTEKVIINSVTKSITPNETGVITKWYVSESSIKTDDFSFWNDGTTVTISGILSKLNSTYYVYAVNFKKGIYSDVESKVYKFIRQQPAPIVTISGNNYSTSRTISVSGVPVGFKIKYSSNGSVWVDDLTTIMGCYPLTSLTEKTFAFYVKCVNETTGEDSLSTKVSVTVSSPQIEIKTFSEKPSSVISFDGWTACGKQTMNNEVKKFNENYQYYPCFAVPASKSFNATALGKNIQPISEFSATVPSGGNNYKIYVLPKQASNVESEFNITIK